jgi:hypothetical protein
MMKSNPAALAFFDVLDECGLGRVRPVVGGIIQLNEQAVVGQKGIVDFSVSSM